MKLKTDPSQDTRDRYHRLLAYARVSGGAQLNRSQVARGWAKVYVSQHKRFQQYRSFKWSQNSAKEAGRGVWGECGRRLPPALRGKHQPPASSARHDRRQQIEDGRLTVRKMTAEERAANPPRPRPELGRGRKRRSG